MQNHMVQKIHIFTAAFLEDGQQLEACIWYQSVRTAIQDRANISTDIDDIGAAHSANGVQHTPDRGGEREGALMK